MSVVYTFILYVAVFFIGNDLFLGRMSRMKMRTHLSLRAVDCLVVEEVVDYLTMTLLKNK